VHITEVCAHRTQEELNAPTSMIEKARMGGYDEFRSTRANPHPRNLTAYAKANGRLDIAERAQAGEFDTL
jgi:hypothetical protein